MGKHHPRSFVEQSYGTCTVLRGDPNSHRRRFRQTGIKQFPTPLTSIDDAKIRRRGTFRAKPALSPCQPRSESQTEEQGKDI